MVRCALRIQQWIKGSESKFVVVTDRQSACILKEAISFIGEESDNINWKPSALLTLIISLNSFSCGSGDSEYVPIRQSTSRRVLLSTLATIHQRSCSQAQRIDRPIFSLYVENFNPSFNIILYCCGKLGPSPSGFERIINSPKTFYQRPFNLNYSFLNSTSYIADILIIYKNHADLKRSLDVSDGIFKRKVDAHISRCQTNLLTPSSRLNQKGELYLYLAIWRRRFFTVIRLSARLCLKTLSHYACD